jgi:hypothetical protein
MVTTFLGRRTPETYPYTTPMVIGGKQRAISSAEAEGIEPTRRLVAGAPVLKFVHS